LEKLSLIAGSLSHLMFFFIISKGYVTGDFFIIVGDALRVDLIALGDFMIPMQIIAP